MSWVRKKAHSLSCKERRRAFGPNGLRTQFDGLARECDEHGLFLKSSAWSFLVVWSETCSMRRDTISESLSINSLSHLLVFPRGRRGGQQITGTLRYSSASRSSSRITKVVVGTRPDIPSISNRAHTSLASPHLLTLFAFKCICSRRADERVILAENVGEVSRKRDGLMIARDGRGRLGLGSRR